MGRLASREFIPQWSRWLIGRGFGYRVTAVAVVLVAESSSVGHRDAGRAKASVDLSPERIVRVNQIGL